jgi:hypothetical protein
LRNWRQGLGLDLKLTSDGTSRRNDVGIDIWEIEVYKIIFGAGRFVIGGV